MGGISGIHGLEAFGTPDGALDAVRRMVCEMAHRGPDSQGTWSDGEHVALGHARLSMLDTSEGANQPFHMGGDVMVFNGEVYNYVEMRRELEAVGAHRFVTDGDTEVVLAALRHWGAREALRRFNGMFAIAWWSSADRRLVIVRDRLGIKPVYWHQTEGGTLVFASEVRTVLASGLVARRLDRAALSDQIMYGTVHAPRTIVRDVQLLPPAHMMVVREEELHIEPYWEAADEALGVADMGPKARRNHIKDTLRDAVALRMRADVAYGAFLSGGIDSSAIVGLMSEVSSTPVSTFSVTFHDAELDESPWSRLIAKRFGTDHHEIRLTPEDFLNQVPSGLAAMDHPSADGLNTYVVSGATRRAGVKVALSGLGGDELFAGYAVFARSARLAELSWLASWPRLGRKLVGKAYAALQPSMTSRKMAEILAGNYFDLAHTYPLSRQIFLQDDLKRMLSSEVPKDNAVFAWLVKELAPGKKSFGLPFLSQVSVAEIQTYMGHTLLRDADQFSMAHALEVRVPFLDHRLVAAALAAPDKVKYPHTPKRLLVESLGGLLPDEVVNRPKMGFVLPWESWMRGDLKAVCERGLAILKDQSWTNAATLSAIEQSFMSGSSTWSFSRVWSLVVLGDYIDRHGLT